MWKVKQPVSSRVESLTQIALVLWYFAPNWACVHRVHVLSLRVCAFLTGLQLLHRRRLTRTSFSPQPHGPTRATQLDRMGGLTLASRNVMCTCSLWRRRNCSGNLVRFIQLCPQQISYVFCKMQM